MVNSYTKCLHCFLPVFQGERAKEKRENERTRENGTEKEKEKERKKERTRVREKPKEMKDEQRAGLNFDDEGKTDVEGRKEGS